LSEEESDEKDQDEKMDENQEAPKEARRIPRKKATQTPGPAKKGRKASKKADKQDEDEDVEDDEEEQEDEVRVNKRRKTHTEKAAAKTKSAAVTRRDTTPVKEKTASASTKKTPGKPSDQGSSSDPFKGEPGMDDDGTLNIKIMWGPSSVRQHVSPTMTVKDLLARVVAANNVTGAAPNTAFPLEYTVSTRNTTVVDTNLPLSMVFFAPASVHRTKKAADILLYVHGYTYVPVLFLVFLLSHISKY
jgi:hypothetical protein